MKMLTLHQPWASLIAVGAKTIETRGWPTDYRVQCIHAPWRRSHLSRVGLRPVSGGRYGRDCDRSEGSRSRVPAGPRWLPNADDRQPRGAGHRSVASSRSGSGMGDRRDPGCPSWSPQWGQGRQRRSESLVAVVSHGALPPRRTDRGPALQGRRSASCVVGALRTVWCRRWTAAPRPQGRESRPSERQAVRHRRRVVLALLPGVARARAKATAA